MIIKRKIDLIQYLFNIYCQLDKIDKANKRTQYKIKYLTKINWTYAS